MPRRKWYVVVQGREVGVYDTWIEAGPLVVGLKDAIYQSFESEEEALRLFDQALNKGQARTISDDDTQPNTSQYRSSPASSGTYYRSTNNYSRGDYNHHRTSHSFSSPRKPGNNNHWQNSWSGTTKVAKSGSLGLLDGATPKASPITRAPSEPASGLAYYDSPDRSVKQEEGVYGFGVGASSQVYPSDGAQTATPKTHSTPASPSHISTPSINVVVFDDPEWIPPYPRQRARSVAKESGSNVLSPLDPHLGLSETMSSFNALSIESVHARSSPKSPTHNADSTTADTPRPLGSPSRRTDRGSPVVERVPPKWSDPRSPNSAVKKPNAFKSADSPWTSPGVRPSPGNRSPVSLLLEPASSAA